MLNFAELIQHTTGPLAGRPLTLRPWQAFRHGSVFGWKKEGGLRRFRTTYHQVAKKNGKTTDTAVPALFTALFDREAAPQGYCAATTRDQAGLLFRELKRMIRASPIDWMPCQDHASIRQGSAGTNGGCRGCIGAAVRPVLPHLPLIEVARRGAESSSMFDKLTEAPDPYTG
ncbi:phage terminase family protein [Cereibacter sphaeroides]